MTPISCSLFFMFVLTPYSLFIIPESLLLNHFSLFLLVGLYYNNTQHTLSEGKAQIDHSVMRYASVWRWRCHQVWSTSWRGLLIQRTPENTPHLDLYPILKIVPWCPFRIHYVVARIKIRTPQVHEFLRLGPSCNFFPRLSYHKAQTLWYAQYSEWNALNLSVQQT